MNFTLFTKAIDLTSIATISKLKCFRSKVFLISLFGLVVTPALCMQVAAQQNSAPTAARTDATSLKTPVDDTRYRIGPGDVLTVIVRKAPELSLEAVRVDQRGMIRIPMISGEVAAACRTESELASQIATLYLEYKNMPSVEVFVREFQSRPVCSTPSSACS